MSHKQCYEKRELLNRENLAQAAEIGRLRQELAAMTARLEDSGALVVKHWEGEKAMYQRVIDAEQARDSALASLAKAKEELEAMRVTWESSIEGKRVLSPASPSAAPKDMK